MARVHPLAFTIPIVLGLGACGGDATETARPGAVSPAGDSAPFAGDATPEDSVLSWIADIRAGIAPLAGQVGADPAGARQRAVELYVTRQERIEQTVGPGTGSGEALEESVHDAEARFHELMQILGTTPPPDSASVDAAIAALDRELSRVLDLVPAQGAAGGAR